MWVEQKQYTTKQDGPLFDFEETERHHEISPYCSELNQHIFNYLKTRLTKLAKINMFIHYKSIIGCTFFIIDEYVEYIHK